MYLQEDDKASYAIKPWKQLVQGWTILSKVVSVGVWPKWQFNIFCGAALCGDLVMGEARRWCMMMSLSYSLNSSASLCKLRHCHPRRHCSHQDRNVLSSHKKGTRNKLALIFSNSLSKGTSPPKTFKKNLEMSAFMFLPMTAVTCPYWLLPGP